jgi:hypothetical protein
MTIETLNTRSVSACYDARLRLMLLVYRGSVTSAATIQAYQWRAEVFQQVGVEHIRGSINDFRAVTQFATANLLTLQAQTSHLGQLVDMNKHAAALVATPEQDSEIERSLDMTLGHDRKRLVRDYDGAVAFLNAWAAENGMQYNIDPTLLNEIPQELR